MRQKTAGSQSGQVALMVLLIMVVLLTAGLALAARTAQNLSLTQQTVESTQVFNAAEEGIEQALISGGTGSFEDADTRVDYRIDQFNYVETVVPEGTTIEFDLSGASAGNRLSLEWSQTSDCGDDPASLVVSIFSVDGGGFSRVRHYAIGPCSATRGDNFSSPTGSSSSLAFGHELSLTNEDLFARIKPVYNDTRLRLTASGWSAPTQLEQVRADATSKIGDESRSISVWRTRETAPSVFDYALYSGTDIIK